MSRGIGVSVPRKEAADKVTGTIKYYNYKKIPSSKLYGNWTEESDDAGSGSHRTSNNNH